MREKHERAIAEAAAAYRRAIEAKETASATLAAAMRAAFEDNEQQSAILKAAGHVWSREYLHIVLGLSRRKDGRPS